MEAVKKGDILLFQRNKKDKVSWFLNGLLKLFEPSYRKLLKQYPFAVWHAAPVIATTSNSVTVMEAQGSGNDTKTFPTVYIKNHCLIFRPVEDAIPQQRIEGYIANYRNTSYDFGAYFGTVVAYLMAKYLKIKWRIVDNQYHCWEITSAFARSVLHKPMQPNYEYPIISKMLAFLSEYEVPDGEK